MAKERLTALLLLIIALIFFSNINIRANATPADYGEDVLTLPKEVRASMESSTPSASLRIPILMYHYVEYVADPGDTIRKSLNIVPFVFEAQLKTLINAGYNFITPSELSQMLAGKEEIPPKPIILSFDDGYQDFYQNVFPLLKKYNVKAVEYVISGFVEKPDFMHPGQIQEIATSGAVEVGSHTVHHLQLAHMSKKEAKLEIEESKIQLEKMIGQPVVSFAYPSGSFDLQAEKLVSDAGYTSAVSTVPGIIATDQNKFFLYRIRPGNRAGEDLLNYLSQNAFKPY